MVRNGAKRVKGLKGLKGLKRIKGIKRIMQQNDAPLPSRAPGART